MGSLVGPQLRIAEVMGKGRLGSQQVSPEELVRMWGSRFLQFLSHTVFMYIQSLSLEAGFQAWHSSTQIPNPW